MQVQVARFELASYSLQNYSNYAIYIFLREVKDILYPLYNVKEQRVATLFFVIETLEGTRWEH